MRLPPPLVGLTPGDLGERDVPAFLAAARSARDGGLAGLILREPGLDDRPLLALARSLRAIFPPGAAFLAVHDRVHVALAAAADGCHLGWRSLDDDAASRALARAGKDVVLSRSTHAGDEEPLFRACAWLVHGPLADVPGKHERVRIVSPAGFAAFVERAGRPVWALGGVDLALVATCRSAGASGIVVRRALWHAEGGPGTAASVLARAWEGSQ